MQSSPQLTPSPVRIPPDLKQWLKSQAVSNKRSMNSEVIFRLEESRNRQSAQGAQA